MTEIVSLGSINVDRVHRTTEARLTDLEGTFDWFPEPGETVAVPEIPSEFTDLDTTRFHGGKGANQAVAAAAAGAEVTMLGKVGPDHADDEVLEALRNSGVRVDRVGVASARTGTAHVFVTDDGENRIVVHGGANEAVDSAYVTERYETITSAEYLVVQNEVPVGPVCDLLEELATSESSPTVLLDPAPIAGVEPLLDRDVVDIVTPNDREYSQLRSALEAFDGTVIHTRGEKPVRVDGTGQFSVSPPDLSPVDTTGAGDAFTGFLGGRLAAGDSLREAVAAATVAGALSTRTEGARGGVPSYAAVQAWQTAE
ncbi:PfkB family carbohydrate kinase [Halobaculum sp. CBA1158]|uniref:PfkB family carbohydrate kinase n=1 Tax=Halobaculum sp. CBA1158 TaxID=2904243 RepID=UPI001F38CCFE|nr:PfkB family carbohydrate kinase [Halobaculum sp. CBA1158]UIP00438.1 PfkB family carbohydrate kinase [Halobaculum sp. CBA1158]